MKGENHGDGFAPGAESFGGHHGNGQTGSITSFTPVTGANSNSTLQFVNVPAPVGVNVRTFRAVVNPPNDGMSGCSGGIAQSTISGFSLAPGNVNQETITVSPTSQ